MKAFNTPIGRASFPNLVEPDKKYERYGIQLLLPKNDPAVKKFMAEVYEAMLEEANDLNSKKARDIVAGQKAIKDGDQASQFKTYRGEYANHWILTANRKAKSGKPGVVNRHKKVINGAEVYPGCDVIAHINVSGYNYKGELGVTIYLQHVMKVSDNERIGGGGIDPDQAFDDIELPEEAVPDTTGFGVNQPENKSRSTNPFAAV